MQGQRVLFVGGQGPVSAPALRLLAPDNEVFAMARFSRPGAREKLGVDGVTCIRHDLFEPFDDLPYDFDYVFHSALPLTRGPTGQPTCRPRSMAPVVGQCYPDLVEQPPAPGPGPRDREEQIP